MGAAGAGQGFRLILASASPRRRELLAQAGYGFEVEAADVDESVREGEAPDAYVRRLAEEKVRAVFERVSEPAEVETQISKARPGAPNVLPGLVVLGADTTVVCDGEILAKPEDAADAMRMLRRLSGEGGPG